ncbi:MAG: hypothetical protein U1F27_00920 [Turneriella sp.]
MFLGANLWYGMNLIAHDRGRHGARTRPLAGDWGHQPAGYGSRESDSEPWRIIPAVQPKPGEYNEKLLQGLDFLLHEMRRRNMTAVVVLGNYWQWSGGLHSTCAGREK